MKINLKKRKHRIRKINSINGIYKNALPFFSFNTRSQLSKHSPQGVQFGAVPMYPRAHTSHLSPPIPSRQTQVPFSLLHCIVSDP